MKRKYDWRRVKSHRPYTIATLAALYGVDPATVRAWIKAGLSCAVISQTRPIILEGAKVKAWMKAREKAKKQPCAPDEMYCVKCKVPRKIAKGSFQTKPTNAEKLTVKGDCKTCGLTLHGFNIAANLHALKARYDPKGAND